MLNTNRILLTNGERRYQRNLVDQLRNLLNVDIFDVEVSYDFYNGSVGGKYYEGISRLMDTESQYKRNILFIIDDFRPYTIKCARELLFYDFNSSTHKAFTPNWDIYFFKSGADQSDARFIQKVMNEGVGSMTRFQSSDTNFDEQSGIIIPVMEQTKILFFTRMDSTKVL